MNSMHHLFICEGNCPLSKRNYDRDLWQIAKYVVRQASRQLQAEADAKMIGGDDDNVENSSLIKSKLRQKCHQDQFDLFDAQLHTDLPLERLTVKSPLTGCGRVYPKLVAILQENWERTADKSTFLPSLEMLLWCCLFHGEIDSKLDQILSAEREIIPPCVLSSLLRLAVYKESSSAVAILLKNGASPVKGLRTDVGFWDTPVGILLDRFESQSTIISGSFYAKTMKLLVEHGADPPVSINHQRPSEKDDKLIDVILKRRLQRSDFYRFHCCDSEARNRRTTAVHNARWLLFETADKDAVMLYLNATPVNELDAALMAAVDFNNNSSSPIASAVNSPQMASILFGMIVMPLLQAGGRFSGEISCQTFIDSFLTKDWFLNVYENSRINGKSWQSPIVLFAVEMCRDKSMDVNNLSATLERLASTQLSVERAVTLQMLAKTIRSHYPRPLQQLARSAVLKTLPQGAKQRPEAIEQLKSNHLLPPLLTDYLNFSDLDMCWREMFLLGAHL